VSRAATLLQMEYLKAKQSIILAVDSLRVIYEAITRALIGKVGNTVDIFLLLKTNY
jgi:hypothetical protein